MILAAIPPTGFSPWMLAVFPFWWCFVVFVLARVGGWHSMAQRYAAGSRPSGGVTYRFRNGGFSAFGSGYRNCLNVTITRDGLYVVPMGPFRVGHTPVLLPWSCVGGIEEKGFLGFRALEVRCGVGKRTFRLYLPTQAAASLAPLEVPPPLPGT